jgi:hypothetical protein
MKNNKVLILGTGHLAYRVKRLAEKRGFEVGQVNIPAHFQKQGAIFDDIQALFSDINLKEMAMVYILDDRDDYNLGLAIALISVDEHVPITVSLFNENITPHLKATHPNIHVLNPAKIAAPQFVESLSAPEIGFLRYQFTPVKEGGSESFTANERQTAEERKVTALTIGVTAFTGASACALGTATSSLALPC